MDDILTYDPTVTTLIDSAANSGDGSSLYDDNTTPGTVASTATPASTATTTPSGWQTLFSTVLPGLVGTAAQGALATQQKTAGTPNKAAASPGVLSGINPLWLGVAALVGLFLILRRR